MEKCSTKDGGLLRAINLNMKKIVEEIVRDKKTCYFVSPHLDDAAFSAGGLISYLAKRTKVVVITTFTRAGKDKHSLSGLAYAKKCGYQGIDMNKFFADRRKEDRELFVELGAKPVHLKFYDALWRKKPSLNLFDKFSSLFINDFRYIYPTHRLHVSKGKIHSHDFSNLRKLENKLLKIIGTDAKSVVFCPLGLGKHVDHIMAREACINVFPQVIYWEDSPYNLYHELDEDFIKGNNLKRKYFRKNQSNRKNMYPAYKTQFGKLFNGEDFNLLPETYYTK